MRDALDGPLAFTVGPDVEDAYGNKNPKTYVRPVGPDSDRPLVDGTPPVLRLVSFVSDNAFDDTLAVPGDTLRLTFEANELVSAPAVTLGAGAGAAAAAVSPVHRAGVAALRNARLPAGGFAHDIPPGEPGPIDGRDTLKGSLVRTQAAHLALLQSSPVGPEEHGHAACVAHFATYAHEIERLRRGR